MHLIVGSPEMDEPQSPHSAAGVSTPALYDIADVLTPARPELLVDWSGRRLSMTRLSAKKVLPEHGHGGSVCLSRSVWRQAADIEPEPQPQSSHLRPSTSDG